VVDKVKSWGVQAIVTGPPPSLGNPPAEYPIRLMRGEYVLLDVHVDAAGTVTTGSRRSG
jgi:hypothetical protein